MCYGLNSPSFVLRASGAFVFLPTSEKQSVPPPPCVTVPVAVAPSIHFHPLGVCQSFVFVHLGELSASMLRSWLWVEEGNICTCGELRKGKSHPPVFMFGVSWGSHFIAVCLGAFFCLFVWKGGDQRHFTLVLCGIHCLDHAGCQGCCSDINNIF